jgi:hypothetical protein
MKGLEGRDVEGFVREPLSEAASEPAALEASWDFPVAQAEPAAELAPEALAEAELETVPSAGSAAEQPQKTKAKGDFFKRWADGFLKLIDDNDLN